MYIKLTGHCNVSYASKVRATMDTMKKSIVLKNNTTFESTVRM